MSTKIACISIDVEKDSGRPGQVPLLFLIMKNQALQQNLSMGPPGGSGRDPSV